MGGEPPFRTARRFAPQSKLPRAPEAHFGEFRLVVTNCERGESPLSHIPPKSPAANQRFAAICFLRARKYPIALNRRDAWSAGLRPASRVSAKPAPTTPPHGAPVSGQFSRWGPAPLREAQLDRVSPTALNRGDGLGNTDLWSAPLREAQRKASVRLMLNVGVPAERRPTPEVGVLPAARLRRAVPTRGRRSRACAPRCPWGYPPRCVARRLRAVHESPVCIESRGRLGERRPLVGTAARRAARPRIAGLH